jgi:hypothetical protein
VSITNLHLVSHVGHTLFSARFSEQNPVPPRLQPQHFPTKAGDENHFAYDELEQNLNATGRAFYCASTMICTPASKAQEVALAFGGAGEKRLREVTTKGGFTRFRRAAETPFNLVLEAPP